MEILGHIGMKYFVSIILTIAFSLVAFGQTAQESRIAEIQAALQKAGLDGAPAMAVV